jgi:signal transduction histidine kinase
MTAMSAPEQRARPVEEPPLDFIPDGSEAARIIREIDWAATPLGDPAGWSASLRMMVRFLLANRFPLLLWWGPDYIQIYNDHYAPILGSKHPAQAMGKPFRECWQEVYPVLRPLVDAPFYGGPATWVEDIELIVRRHGFPEESHFTIAYSPVPDESAPRGIGGVLATVHEISAKVIGQRRVGILGELGARITAAQSDVQACREAIDILAKHPKDLPFALIYLVDDARRQLRRIATTGLDPAFAGPASLPLDALPENLPWPLAATLRSESIATREGLARQLAPMARGPWPDPPDALAVLPLRSHLVGQPVGVLVAGLSACQRLDVLYVGFLELLASQIATAVAGARAYAAERQRATALAEIDRAKTAFFSNVSHEFRTPLTLMLAPLEDALAMPALTPPLRTQLGLAQRNAQRLLKLVNSLLDFARIEAERAQASFRPVDLAALTSDLASTFRSAMERAALRFEVDCEALPEPVYVDPGMWEKIVLNLLSNALKFTLEGMVSVRVRHEARHAVLEVRDTGSGIPAAELPKIFERFHRVEGARGRTHEGSGIGLALVQGLVKLHGGSIEVASECGAGTRFRVRIPCGAAHLPAAQVRHSPERSTASAAEAYLAEALSWLGESPSGTGPAYEPTAPAGDARFASTFNARIVLADDNADMRAYMGNLFGSCYRVEAVADGEAALAAARRERPELILSDVMMPKLDGFAFLKAVRADPGLRDIPVVLLSARAGEDARIEGLGAGADDYIVKPFNARELLTRIGALIELTRTRRESEERLRAYVKATSDVVYVMSADWSETRQLQGQDFTADRAQASGNLLERFIPAEEQPRLRAAIDEAIRTKSIFQLEHRVIRHDGTLGWSFSRAIPLLDSKGNITEWFGAASDISERREAQEALRRQQAELQAADRQKNEFLAMLAHELRNPLAPIRNAGELLARRLNGDPGAGAALSTISRQVTHLARLVDDLLDISRITQGRIELRRHPVRLTEIISRAIETIDPLIEQKNHRIVIASSRRPLLVSADPERLTQCFGNVLANAAKYTDPNGEIRIETRAEADQAVITIVDNGVGISAELLPRVFDLFVQGSRTLDRSQGGLGIGLSLVKRLIDMHDGLITLSSAGEGQGTTVEMRLPLISGRELQTHATPAPSPPPRRIFIVDDNQDAAETLSRLLECDRHTVASAYSGAQALQSIRNFHPDVVLLDIGLPGLDGYEVARLIRNDPANADVQLVAITGYGQHADRERARAAGFVEHLVKPLEYAALQRLLANLARAP